jgi:hypothetical protein
VAKYGTTKWHHAVIWGGSQEPQPQPNELPIDGEYGMMASIRVVPKLRSDKLHHMSRVNFAKIYTVEHNVKVYNFGDVHVESLDVLRHQWNYALARNVEGEVEAAPKDPSALEPVDEGSDEEEEDGHDDEEREEEKEEEEDD